MRLLILLILLFHSVSAFSQAEFFVRKRVCNFGKIREGIQLKHIFTIVNIGDEPLIIYDFEVCKGVKVTLPRPIAAGNEAEVTVEFNTNGNLYYQFCDIVLITNTLKKREHIHIKTYVTPD